MIVAKNSDEERADEAGESKLSAESKDSVKQTQEKLSKSNEGRLQQKTAKSNTDNVGDEAKSDKVKREQSKQSNKVSS